MLPLREQDAAAPVAAPVVHVLLREVMWHMPLYVPPRPKPLPLSRTRQLSPLQRHEYNVACAHGLTRKMQLMATLDKAALAEGRWYACTNYDNGPPTCWLPATQVCEWVLAHAPADTHTVLRHFVLPPLDIVSTERHQGSTSTRCDYGVTLNAVAVTDTRKRPAMRDDDETFPKRIRRDLPPADDAAPLLPPIPPAFNLGNDLTLVDLYAD